MIEELKNKILKDESLTKGEMSWMISEIERLQADVELFEFPVCLDNVYKYEQNNWQTVIRNAVTHTEIALRIKTDIRPFNEPGVWYIWNHRKLKHATSRQIPLLEAVPLSQHMKKD